MALPAGMSSCAGCVELMVGTTFVDASDEVSVITPDAWSRMSDQAYVFGEDTAVTTTGKLEPVEVTARGVYTESTTSFYYQLWTAHTTPCGALAAIRYSPAGCVSTHRSHRTSTTASRIISMTPPPMSADSAEVLMWEAVIRSPDYTEGAWA
jgi:hypothetical protein